MILSAFSATSAGEDTTFKKKCEGTLFKLKCNQFLESKQDPLFTHASNSDSE